MTPEELRRIRASLATTATSGVYMGAVLADIVALLAEVDRFRNAIRRVHSRNRR